MEIFKYGYGEAELAYNRLATYFYRDRINTEAVLSIYREISDADEEKRNKLRQKLYRLLQTSYQNLALLNFRQLHFHLPDNHSFLRFHKPEKYGDDLTGIRYSIEQTNLNKKPYRGFEEGRVFNGFRNLFPIIDHDGTHLGSVEVSIAYAALQKEIQRLSDGYVQFMIKKDIVEKKVWKSQQSFYHPSEIHPAYLNESRHKDIFPSGFDAALLSRLNHQLNEEVINRINKAEEIAVHLEDSGHGYIALFVPVPNVQGHPAASYLYSYIETPVILESLKITRYVTLMVIVLLVLVFYFARIMIRSHYQILEQQEELKQSEEELRQLNHTLADQVEEQVVMRMEEAKRHEQERMTQERLLIQSSKMAEMGEMINVIAHQWKQPLNGIMLLAQDLPERYEYDELDEESINYISQQVMEQVLFLSSTIDSFRRFLTPSKEITEFDCLNAINHVLSILWPQFEKLSMEVVLITSKKDIIIRGYENEFKQVILNIINNAKDALLEKNVPSPKVEIRMEVNHPVLSIMIDDNAGGIPLELLPDKIFESYVSTKGDKGTGIGLSMSKTIIEEHMQGTISASNTKLGACFNIQLPLNIKGKMEEA